MKLFARKKAAIETWPPRPGRCGLVFGWVETEDGPKLMRYGGDVGVEAIGGQGSGKSRGLVKPSLLVEDVHEDARAWTENQRRFHPYGYETVKIVLDIKGDLFQSTAGFRASLGEHVYVIDPFSTDPGVSKKNPFDSGRIGTAFMFRDYLRFANWVCEPAINKDPDYWSNTSIEAFAGFAGHMAWRSIVEKNPALNSPCGLIRFVTSFDNIDGAIRAVQAYEHDPHGVYGWLEEEDGVVTDRPTKTCPWIAQTMNALQAKAAEEKSGIYGSTLQHLSIYKDELLAANITTSTFRWRDLVNDPDHSSVVYIRMPAADIDNCLPYVRLLINDMMYELLQPTVTIDGREARGNLREWMLLLEEAAALKRMEIVERSAAYMRGLGGKLITIWQNRNQIIKTYGKEETISQNQGLHLYYRPEKYEDCEYLSNKLGKTTHVVQERNVSGDRMSIMPRSHVADSNRTEDRLNFTPFEVGNIAKTDVIFSSDGMNGIVHQAFYDEFVILEQRSLIHPPTKAHVSSTVPWCIENLESELGPEKWALMNTPAPDKYERNRESAEEQKNGCRVHRWEYVREETGMKLYCAQVWLPDARKPVLDEKKGYRSHMEREEAITATLASFDDRDSTATPKVAKVVKNTDKPLEAAAQLFALESP